jgi:hypothetical protein
MIARRPVIIGAWCLTLGLLGVLGFTLISTSYMIYDDEGYVLWSVQQFCEGKPLYTEVFSQYGPLFYLGYRALQAVTGVVFNHDTGRMLTLFYWVATCGVAGVLTQRLTRSLTAGLAVTGLTFLTLVKNINEPFHPGSLLALMSAIAALSGAELIRRGRTTLMATVITGIAMVMLFIKINVGGLLLCTLGSWWLVTEGDSGNAQGKRQRTWLAALATALVPMLLMRAHTDTTWAMCYATVFTAGALGLLWQLHHARDPAPRAVPNQLPAAVLAVGMGAGVVGLMALMGTGPAALLEGVLLAPLRHPGVYTFPAKVSPAATALALGLLGAGVIGARWTNHARYRAMIVSLRLMAGGWFFAQLPNAIMTGGQETFLLAWGPSLAALMCLPLGNANPRWVQARLWVGLVYVWQTLHAYPVAGTQVAWGSFLGITLIITGWNESAQYFWRRRPIVGRGLLMVPLIMSGVMVAQLAQHTQIAWGNSVDVKLPGASLLRPDFLIAYDLKAIEHNLRRESDTVFSLPGMFSFNIWSGRPTPTAANATHWFSLLNPSQQAVIQQRLEKDPRAMVVFHRDHLHYLYKTGIGPTGPLKDYILTAFQPAIRLGAYDVWVKSGRTIPAVGTFLMQEGRIFTALDPSLNGTVQVSLRSLYTSAPDYTLPQPQLTHVDGLRWITTTAPANLPDKHRWLLVLRDAAGAELAILPQNTAPNLQPPRLSPAPKANERESNGGAQPPS